MDTQDVVEEIGRDRLDAPASQSSRGSRRLWLVLALAAVVAILAAVWFLRPQQDAAQKAAGRPELPVQVATVATAVADLPVNLDALGTVTPLATVTVRTRIDGQLTKVAFREGQHVRKGDFLVEVDPRPYRAALDQAEAQLARDQALLRNAELDVNRYRNLVAEDSIARQTLDTQESLVRQYRATVKVDQALVDTARLNLDYCRIVSPIEGRVGLRQVDEGNYVQTGDAEGIVVVTQLQPITVVFTIPEDNLQKVMARMRAGAALPVRAFDRSGASELARGVLTTMDNQVDPATGTIKLKAQFDNADERLFPNQFVNVRLLVETLPDATVIPSAAVQRGSQGAFVYVVGAEATAAVRPVSIGASGDERTQVTAGLVAGEQVVIDGVDRLRDGIKVKVADKAAAGPGGSPGASSGGSSGGAAPAVAGATARPGGG